MTFKEWRKLRGMTQVDVANALGVGQATVLRWEKGKGKPMPKQYPKLMSLGLTQDELLEMFFGVKK